MKLFTYIGGMLSGYPLYYVKKWCAQKLKPKKQKNNINSKENGDLLQNNLFKKI